MEPYMGLKAGDKVFVFYYTDKTLSVVERITPKGFVKVKGILYDRNGIQRGGSEWHKSRIEPATEEMLLEYTREELVRATIKKMREVTKITYEQAVSINAILNG